MDLTNYMFPVVERPISVHDWPEDRSGTENQNAASRYKVIMREDTDEIISVVRDSYKLIPNADLINRMMDELDGLGMTSYIDEAHSFANNHRMRLQITFPGITFKDGDSEIAFSLFLHNSYDMSEPVRIASGGIRYICGNGMVFLKVLAQFVARHTRGFRMDRGLEQSLRSACDNWPIVERRAIALASTPVTGEMYDRIYREVGLAMTEMIMGTMPETEWSAYNEGTWIASHEIEQGKRADYQQALSRAFEL